MKTAIVIVDGSPENGYSAYLEKLPGVISEGDNWEDLKFNIEDALSNSLQIMEQEKMPIPKEFNGEYKLEFVLPFNKSFDLLSFVKSSVVAKRANMNVAQLSHYMTGVRNPSSHQIEKIEKALHGIGQELLSVRLKPSSPPY